MKVVFVIEGTDNSVTIDMPIIPRVGEQVYLSDFIDEQQNISLTKKGVKLDSEVVNHVCWMKDEKGIYVSIFLNEG